MQHGHLVELAVLVACSFVDVVAFRKDISKKGRRAVQESQDYVQYGEQGLQCWPASALEPCSVHLAARLTPGTRRPDYAQDRIYQVEGI